MAGRWTLDSQWFTNGNPWKPSIYCWDIEIIQYLLFIGGDTLLQKVSLRHLCWLEYIYIYMYIFSLWDHCKDNEGIYGNIYLLHVNATNSNNKFNNIQKWCRNISNAVLTNTFYSAAEQLLENISSQQRAVSMPKKTHCPPLETRTTWGIRLFKSHTCMFYHLPMHEVLQKVSTCFNWFPRELSFGDIAHGSPQKLPKH